MILIMIFQGHLVPDDLANDLVIFYYPNSNSYPNPIIKNSNFPDIEFSIICMMPERWVAIEKTLGQLSCSTFGKSFNSAEIRSKGKIQGYGQGLCQVLVWVKIRVRVAIIDLSAIHMILKYGQLLDSWFWVATAKMLVQDRVVVGGGLTLFKIVLNVSIRLSLKNTICYLLSLIALLYCSYLICGQLCL